MALMWVVFRYSSCPEISIKFLVRNKQILGINWMISTKDKTLFLRITGLVSYNATKWKLHLPKTIQLYVQFVSLIIAFIQAVMMIFIGEKQKES